MTRATEVRRTGGADVELVPLPPAPPFDSWTPALLDALSASLGRRVRFARGPDEPEGRALGPWAFPSALETADAELPPAWTGSLVVRIADREAEVRREDAALRFAAAHGLGAPTALACVELDDTPPAGDELRATHALVTAVPDLVPLPDLIGYNLKYADDLLGGFARAHATLHECDPHGLDEVVPVLSVADELARIDGTRFGVELAWLRAQTLPPTRLVLCHGGYQPMCVSGPPPGRWEDTGGPGSGLVAGNWNGALLAPREYDIAMTLTAFWMAPFFAPNRSERTAFKLIRNTLSNRYRLEYAAVAPFDAGALRFWLGFHALRGMARLADAYDYDGSRFAAPERGGLPSVIAPELGRLFKMQQRG